MLGLLRHCFFIFCFFPYLSPYPITTDLQPISLILACVIIVLYGRSVLKVDGITAVVIGFIGLVSLVSIYDVISFGLTFNTIRGWLAYSSFAIHFLAFSLIFRNIPTTSVLKYSSKAIWVYIAVAAVQHIVNLSFLGYFINLPDTVSFGGGRGVSSLTAEPTFFALTSLLLFLVTSTVSHPYRRSVTFAVLLSGSITGLFNLIILAPISFIKRITIIDLIKFIVILMFLMFSTWLILENFFEGSRSQRFFSNIINTGGLWNAAVTDQSGNDRIGSFFISALSIFESGIFPKGFNSWAAYVSGYDGILSETYGAVTTGHGRIHSSLGAIIFELGLLGVLFTSYMLVVCFQNNRFVTFGLLLLLCQTTPWSHPLLSLAFFLASYKGGGQLSASFELGENVGTNKGSLKEARKQL